MNIGFIGTGTIATSVIEGLFRSKIKVKQILISERSKKNSSALSKKFKKVKVVKNKIAPPFRRAEFDIMYGKGISKSGEIVDLAVEHEIVKKSGSWFSYGETKLGQGRDAVKELLEDNPELSEEIENKIKAGLASK